MTNQYVTKAVSFNIADPDQKSLYDHAMKRKNFSSYMKRLIQRDIDNAFVPQTIQSSPEDDVKMDDSLINNLI